MSQEFNAIDEVRKHPGVAAGVIFVLAGVGLATLLMNQRTGPRRYEVLRDRINPRGWIDREALRDRFDDVAHGVRGRMDDIGHGLSQGLSQSLGQKASGLTDYASETAGRLGDRIRGSKRGWGKKSGRSRHRQVRDYKKQARRYAEDAGDFARDHAREGSAILAIATIAAAIGAAALENHRKR